MASVRVIKPRQHAQMSSRIATGPARLGGQSERNSSGDNQEEAPLPVGTREEACPEDVRKKKLSKAVHGTSHAISLAEARHVHRKGAVRLLTGAGQQHRVRLSEEAADLLKRHRCRVELLPTPEMVPVWNQAEGAVIGLVHVTG
jgi:hypothetical protein